MEFWVGLAVIPAVVLLAALTVVTYAVSTWLWRRLHRSLLARVDVERNPFSFDDDGRPEYLDAANRFRDALLESPRMYSSSALGWLVLVVRDTTSTSAKTSADG